MTERDGNKGITDLMRFRYPDDGRCGHVHNSQTGCAERRSKLSDEGYQKKTGMKYLSLGRFFLIRRQTEAGVERTNRNRGSLYGIKIRVHLLCDDGEDVVALWRINV